SSVKNRCGNQGDAKNNGTKVKTDDTRYAFGGSRIVGDVVSRHPIFIAPDITQQHEHEAGEIKDEFLDWNCSTHCRYLPTECRRLVWENEKGIAKEHVEHKTKWREHRDRSPKCFSRKLQIGLAGKPPPQRRDGNNKQEQAPSISERRRIIRGRLQNDRVNGGVQCDRSRNNERRGDGEHDIERFRALSHKTNSINRTF